MIQVIRLLLLLLLQLIPLQQGHTRVVQPQPRMTMVMGEPLKLQQLQQLLHMILPRPIMHNHQQQQPTLLQTLTIKVRQCSYYMSCNI